MSARSHKAIQSLIQAGKASPLSKAMEKEASITEHVTKRYMGYVVGAFASTSLRLIPLLILVGVIAGSHFLGGPGIIHPRDLQMWSTFNDFAASTGAGEGFMPQGALNLLGMVGAGANVIGKIPT